MDMKTFVWLSTVRQKQGTIGAAPGGQKQPLHRSQLRPGKNNMQEISAADLTQLLFYCGYCLKPSDNDGSLFLRRDANVYLSVWHVRIFQVRFSDSAINRKYLIYIIMFI